jgi:hypothetical protein
MRAYYSQLSVESRGKMAGRRKSPRMLYTTKDVAKMLGVENWRIKNFSEGGTYGLPPAIHVGRGRGSRRLYDRPSIYRLLIANEMVECGFTPEAVGRAIREIPESKLVGQSRSYSNYEVLCCQHHSRWSVMTPEKLEQQSKLGTLVVVPFQQLILEFEQRTHTRFAGFSEDSEEEDPDG